MTRKAAVFAVIVALMLALLVSLAVYAAGTRAQGQQGMPCPQMGMGGGMRGPGMMLQRLAVELKLTDVQKQQMQGIWKEFQTETQADRESLKTTKGDLITLMASQSPDKAKAEDLIAQMNTLQGKIMTVGIDKMIEAKQLLTPEQNQILAQRIAQFKPMMMHCGMGK